MEITINGKFAFAAFAVLNARLNSKKHNFIIVSNDEKADFTFNELNTKQIRRSWDKFVVDNKLEGTPLVERKRRGRKKQEKFNEEQLEAVLTFFKENEGEYPRRAVSEALDDQGIPDDVVQFAIYHLRDEGEIWQIGKKRGAKYCLAKN